MNQTPADDEIQKLVYGISHDMGAPLRAVIRFSELFNSRVADRLDDKEKYWLELIHDGGIKAQSMVDALLQYSRLNTLKGNDQPFRLAELIQQRVNAQLQQYQLQFPDRPAPICEWQLDEDFELRSKAYWTLMIDHISQNALLYQPHDPQHQAHIQVSLTTLNDALVFSVADNGIGLSEEHARNATRPFMRGVSDQEYPGIGMGLSYCDRIAQLQGGSIDIQQSSQGGCLVSYRFDRE